MFLDDTACNLASLNLLAFCTSADRSPDGALSAPSGEPTLDLDGYEHAVRLWTVVLEISVLMAQFPSREIAQRSHDYRTLGLGYANLGGLLMSLGLPYDCDAGRAIAAALAAIIKARAKGLHLCLAGVHESAHRMIEMLVALDLIYETVDPAVRAEFHAFLVQQISHMFHFHHIARHDRFHPFGRPGGNDISGIKRYVLRNERDEPRHAESHTPGIVLLTNFPVHSHNHVQLDRLFYLIRQDDPWAHRAKSVNSLRAEPRLCHRKVFRLHIPCGYIIYTRIPGNNIHRPE